MPNINEVIKGLQHCTKNPKIKNHEKWGVKKELECEGCPNRYTGCCEYCLMRDSLALLKEQRWIPITERLPKEKETVLLSDGYDVLYGYITTNRDFILVDEALSKDNFLIKSKEHWGISHWMPLPKIPKDGEQ